MDHIKSQLDQLAELSDEQVAELQTSIVSEFDQVAETGDITPQNVDAMTTLADMLETVRSETTRRVAQAEELATRAAEATSRVHAKSEPTEEETVEAPAEDAPADEDAKEEEFAAAEATATVDAEPAAELSTTEVAPEAAPEPAAEAATTEAPAVEAEPAPETAVETEPVDVVEVVETAPVETEPVSADAAAEAATEEVAAEAAPAETELATEASAEAVVEAETEAEASTTEEHTSAPEAQEEAPVTAAAEGTFEAPADRQPNLEATATPVAITAGADIPGYTAGSSIDSLSEVAVAMEKRIHSLRRVNGGDGEQHIVASLTTHYPDEYVLGNDAEENTAKITAAAGPEVIRASGGFLAPLEASYDIYNIGSTASRPVRDSLPRFQADRGGIRFIKPPLLSSYTGAVGIWTEANDIAAADNNGTDDLVKNVLIVGGAQEGTAMTYAVTLQLQFGNLLTRAYPELIARHNELALVQHARLAELTLLNKINAASTAVTAGKELGFARDFIVQIRRAAVAYRSRHRIARDTQLRAIVPDWIYDAMSADLVKNMPGDDNLGATVADINSYLALSNVTLTASPDQNQFGAQNAGALLDWPTSFTWYLFSEGSFVFLDGGTLDIGLVRDSGLVATNDYRMFTETFEGLAFVGVESLAITSTLSVNGTAAALEDTTPTVS